MKIPTIIASAGMVARLDAIKNRIKSIPILGRIAIYLRARILGGPSSYAFVRHSLETKEGASESERGRLRLINVLNYIKASGSNYAAEQYPAGYQSITVGDQFLKGQRDPLSRLSLAPVDLNGKSVLDVGCNYGGMLFAAQEHGIRWGVGIDYDPRLINAANLIRSLRGERNLDFFVFDVDREDLSIINDFLPQPRVDIVFLLSVCMWIKRWRQVIDFCVKISPAMLFETNGSGAQQAEQEDYLIGVFPSVKQLARESPDDPHQKRRKLYLCERPIFAGPARRSTGCTA